MSDVAEQLRTALFEARPKLHAVSETEAAREGGAGKWAKKEILGHLIDSALNNHRDSSGLNWLIGWCGLDTSRTPGFRSRTIGSALGPSWWNSGINSTAICST